MKVLLNVTPEALVRLRSTEPCRAIRFREDPDGSFQLEVAADELAAIAMAEEDGIHFSLTEKLRAARNPPTVNGLLDPFRCDGAGPRGPRLYVLGRGKDQLASWVRHERIIPDRWVAVFDPSTACGIEFEEGDLLVYLPDWKANREHQGIVRELERSFASSTRPHAVDLSGAWR